MHDLPCCPFCLITRSFAQNRAKYHSGVDDDPTPTQENMDGERGSSGSLAPSIKQITISPFEILRGIQIFFPKFLSHAY